MDASQDQRTEPTDESEDPFFSDYATLAYDAFTGGNIWVRRYDGPGNDVDRARALAVSPDGTKVYVTGGSLGLTTDYDYATIAYEA